MLYRFTPVTLYTENLHFVIENFDLVVYNVEHGAIFAQICYK